MEDKIETTSAPNTIRNIDKEWIETNVDWIDDELYYNNLITNKIIFSVDGLFYPDKSYLVAAFILVSIGPKVVLKARFITTVVLNYRHSYTVELCGTLGIYVILKETTPREIYTKVKVKISTDC